jgi:hypothetical protein
MLDGEGLHPSSKGARVKMTGGKATVIDGPFAEAKELVAGYWVIQARSLEEAVEWMKRCPAPPVGEFDLEIRRIYENEDFGEHLTPDQAAREDKMRAEVAQRQQ